MLRGLPLLFLIVLGSKPVNSKAGEVRLPNPVGAQKVTTESQMPDTELQELDFSLLILSLL